MEDPLCNSSFGSMVTLDYVTPDTKEKTWGEMCKAYKEMSRAVGEEATGGPESNSPPENEGGRGGGRRLLRPHDTRLALWEEHLQDPSGALEKALKCVENRYWRSRPEYFGEGAFSNGCCWLPPKFVGKADLGPTWIRWTVCVCAQRPWNGMCQWKYGPHGELFFFLIQGGAGDCAEQ